MRFAVRSGMKSLLTFVLAASATVATLPASPLGLAGEFNVFLFGDYTAQYTDVEGRVAVGHDFTGTGLGLNSNLVAGADGVIVGNAASLSNGQLYSGNLRYGASHNSTINFLNGASVQGGIGSFFSGAQSYLQSLSAQLSGQAANGSTVTNVGNLMLTGTSTSLNVFDVSSSFLSSANFLNIDVPDTSTVLVNVLYGTGASNQFENFAVALNGTPKQNVLFHFANPGSLSIQRISVPGSILAPYSNVTFNNGNLEGTLIAQSLSGNGEFHDSRFMGDLPNDSVPEPGTYGLLALGIGAFLIAKSRAILSAKVKKYL